MQPLAAIALAAAAIASGQPKAAAPLPAPAPAPTQCADPAATVHGPPAPELFDPHRPRAGGATWCEVYDREGRSLRDGPYTDHYPGGAPRARAHFVAGVLEGDVEVRHESGGVWLRTRYVAGRQDGPYVMFRPDGTLWMRGTHRAGRLHGPLSLHHPDGSLASETSWVDGREHGTSRAFWPNGVPRREREVVDGVWNGPAATWYPNGRVRSLGRWAPCPDDATAASCAVHGAARHGRWQTWHESGQRASRGHYRYGEKVGTWVYWDAAGEPELVDVHRGGGLVRSIRGLREAPPAAPAAVSSAPGS